MTIKEDIIETKKELEEVRKQSFAFELLNDQRKQNKRLFIIWLITFLMFIGLLCYTVYLLNDISVITTDQEITDVETIENSSITNGDVYGEN